MAGVAVAQDWGKLATISTTMGVSDSRLCLGEGSRGDIGCHRFDGSWTAPRPGIAILPRVAPVESCLVLVRMLRSGPTAGTARAVIAGVSLYQEAESDATDNRLICWTISL
jgi:hypothetical protein